MSIDVTKVKTFQPILPAGAGPIFPEPYNAIFDIVLDIKEEAILCKKTVNAVNDAEMDKFIDLIEKGLGVSDWIDGEYTLFEDYKLKVHTYQQWQLDEMGEFSGY